MCQTPSDFQRSRLPLTLPIADTIPNRHDCSYLDGKSANLPLLLPGRLLTPQHFDVVVEKGIRRSGVFLYHTACPQCNACEPSRVRVSEYALTESTRRVLNRGDRELEIQAGPPSVDEVRLQLFNRHRTVRGLGDSDQTYVEGEYENFLVDSCNSQTVELSFWKGNQLAAVSIVDCGLNSLSAVYTYFDPAFSKLSIGTFSILKQMEFARNTEREFLYLGMYVAQNQHLSYKQRFTPQERWIDGRWVRFDK